MKKAQIFPMLADPNETESDRIFPASSNMEPGRFYRADETRYTATRTRGRNGQIIPIANCTTKDQPDGMPLVTLANEERFTAAFYSEPLTQYATGWTDPEDLQAMTGFIAPRVPVGRRFEYKQAVNSEAFLSELDDARAIGAEFKRVEYKGTSVNSKTNNRGLSYRIDLDEEGAGILTEELIVARLLQRLWRNKLRRAYTVLLASVTTTSALTWASGTPTPVADIDAMILAGVKDAGVPANRILMDYQAWVYRRKGLHGVLTAGAIAEFQMSFDEFVGLIGLQSGKLNRAVYQTSATAKTLISNAKVITFIGQDSPSRDDPTNVKQFVTPVGDGDFRVYRQPVGAKFVDITVECYDAMEGTSTVGAQARTIS
jgi:hypothetical protein